MIERDTGAVPRGLRTLFDAGAAAGMTDRSLLERFLSRRDGGSEAAFRALVARHGAMVLGVCRRVLADPHDAEDAFQATFLILVRKARSVRVEDSLGRWLYGVSTRVAHRARAVAARRGARESPAGDDLPAPPDARCASDVAELRAVLDEELGRLPECYRAPVVLCDLGGLTQEEAAKELRCPLGTVKSRLARGRERLRGRLARRGLAPSACLAAASLSAAAGAAVPERLAESTARAAILDVSGGVAGAGAFPAAVAALAEGVLTSMVTVQLKALAGALVAIGLVAGGTYVHALQGPGNAPRESPAKDGTPREDGAPRERPALGPPASGAAELSDELRDELELLAVQLEGKNAELARAEANAEVALADLATRVRLNQRKPGMVSQEEMRKSEHEVAVAKAQVGVARSGVREVEIRMAQVRRLQDHPERLNKFLDFRAITNSPAALDRRLRELERKLDRVIQALEDANRRVPGGVP